MARGGMAYGEGVERASEKMSKCQFRESLLAEGGLAAQARRKFRRSVRNSPSCVCILLMSSTINNASTSAEQKSSGYSASLIEIRHNHFVFLLGSRARGCEVSVSM